MFRQKHTVSSANLSWGNQNAKIHFFLNAFINQLAISWLLPPFSNALPILYGITIVYQTLHKSYQFVFIP